MMKKLAVNVLWSLFMVVLSCSTVYAKMSVGPDSFTFVDNDKKMKVWYYNPSNEVNKKMPIVFVMHGVKRDAMQYRDAWIEYAKAKNFLLVVPEFSDDIFRGEAYNTGNMIASNGSINPKNEWSFSIIERLFQHVKVENDLETEKYVLYGHSAGAQFVHRFVEFFPEASLELAIAANAGWYTLLDHNKAFPYGIKDVMLTENDISTIFSKNFVVLLGEEDKNMFDKSLRNTPQAKEQGFTRFERGNTYFNVSKQLAMKKDMPFHWKLVYVEGVGHSNSGMAKEAAKMIQ